MLQGPQHISYSSDAAISTANAASFGVKWMANLYSADLGSPVVSYNAKLGKNVVYVGNQRADLYAIDAATGQTVWSTNLGLNDKIEDTPAVDSAGNIWVGTSYNAALYKVNGATGAVMCSVPAALPINASPMIATPPGGVATVYWGYIDTDAFQGPIIATRQSDCSQIFKFSKYVMHAGSWTTPALAVTAAGRPLIVIGTADPDSREYAIDANTGALVWKFAIENPAPGFFDIGDAATISQPGNNGIVGGAVYFNTKYGDEYALDLATGTQRWRFKISPNLRSASSSRSSAALVGRKLVFGYGQDSGFGGSGGVYAVDAVNGTALWQFPDATEVLSSPAVAGPAGSEVVTFADIAGAFRILDLATGKQLYKWQTRGYATASPAISNGTVYLTSSDGFLYAFAPGQANGAPPSTTISSPATGANLTNPNGNVTITGTSTAASGVAAVEIAVQENGSEAPWYNAASAWYTNAPVRNAAMLTSPGAASTTWSFSLPAPAAGATFRVVANTVAADHLVDRGTNTSFAVKPSVGEPNITISSAFVSPGSTIKASSTAFQPGEVASFTLFGKTLASATVTQSGYVPPTQLQIPAGAPFGATTLSLTGATSRKTTTAAIYVTNNWSQAGHDIMHSAFEAHDTVIQGAVSVGNGSVLSRSWYYQSGAPVNSSPSVVDGVAYFGNDAGTMTALAVNTGAPLWTYTTAAGLPIATAPAVDTSGNVFFTSADSSLYVLNPSGQLLGAVTLGGTLSAPAIAFDNVYVASTNGTLYVVSAASRTLAWSATLPAAAHGAPAYDALPGILVAADDSGAVSAFNVFSHAPLWSAQTGGPIFGSPMIAGKNVYVASKDGYLYAFSEQSGALAWKRAMSAAVTAAPAVYNGGDIVAGDANGLVEIFDAAGNVQHKTATSTPIAAITSVAGNIFVTHTNGIVGMIRIGGPVPYGWSYKTASTLSTAATIVDGTVYIGAADGGVYAFTPQGANPLARRTVRLK